MELTTVAERLAEIIRCHGMMMTPAGQPPRGSTRAGRSGLCSGDAIRGCIGRSRCLRCAAGSSSMPPTPDALIAGMDEAERRFRIDCEQEGREPGL